MPNKPLTKPQIKEHILKAHGTAFTELIELDCSFNRVFDKMVEAGIPIQIIIHFLRTGIIDACEQKRFVMSNVKQEEIIPVDDYDFHEAYKETLRR